MSEAPITPDDVHDFFALVLAEDPAALRRVDDAPGLERRPEGFVFTLPALHALLDPQRSIDYPGFRKRLYASSLNRDLGALGAEIVPFEPTGKVDSSRYCLRRRPPP